MSIGQSLRHAKCSECGDPIVWMVTPNGSSNVAVNPDGVDEAELEWGENGRAIFDPPQHQAHSATCPFANNFRRRNVRSKG